MYLDKFNVQIEKAKIIKGLKYMEVLYKYLTRHGFNQSDLKKLLSNENGTFWNDDAKFFELPLIVYSEIAKLLHKETVEVIAELYQVDQESQTTCINPKNPIDKTEEILERVKMYCFDVLRDFKVYRLKSNDFEDWYQIVDIEKKETRFSPLELILREMYSQEIIGIPPMDQRDPFCISRLIGFSNMPADPIFHESDVRDLAGFLSLYYNEVYLDIYNTFEQIEEDYYGLMENSEELVLLKHKYRLAGFEDDVNCDDKIIVFSYVDEITDKREYKFYHTCYINLGNGKPWHRKDTILGLDSDLRKFLSKYDMADFDRTSLKDTIQNATVMIDDLTELKLYRDCDVLLTRVLKKLQNIPNSAPYREYEIPIKDKERERFIKFLAIYNHDTLSYYWKYISIS